MKNRLLFILFYALLSIGNAQAVSLDAGRSAYASNCASCHGALGSAWNASAQSIQNAIQNNRGGMGRLSSLSATVLADLAAYMANPTATDTSTGTGTTGTTGTAGTTGTTGTTCTASATGSTDADNDADADRLYNWAEDRYAGFFGGKSNSEKSSGFLVRHYPNANVFLASRNGRIYFYDGNRPTDGLLDIGNIFDWLSQAGLTTTTGSTSSTGSNCGNAGQNGDDHDDDDNGDDDHHGSNHHSGHHGDRDNDD